MYEIFINNQSEVLRAKNGMTTTVIKVTKNFTTVNSTTNDVMDWEFTITNLFTKMVQKNWGFPAIIKEKKGFRYGIVGHRVDKCIVFPARRPVVTVTTTMATTIANTIIEKIHSEPEKKI